MTLPEAARGTHQRRHSASADFVMVHLDLIDELDGSWDAAALLNRIEYRAGAGWWPATRADMQRELRMTEHRIKVALALLRERGKVRSRRVKPFEPVREWRPWYADDEPDVTAGDTVTETAAGSGTETERDAVTTVLEERSEELTPPNPPEGGELFAMPAPSQPSTAVEPLPPHVSFVKWYDLYPRKVSRGAAEKAWAKAVKRADPEVIIAGLVAQLPMLRGRLERGEGKFIPHPATWLNGDRWADQLPTRQDEVGPAAPGSIRPTLEAAMSGRSGPVVDPWAAAGLDSPASAGPPALDPANERNRA